jgi:hypothetical protein
MGDFPGAFDNPGGVNDFEKQRQNAKPWFQRWYVWVLPLLVLVGALLMAYR